MGGKANSSSSQLLLDCLWLTGVECNLPVRLVVFDHGEYSTEVFNDWGDTQVPGLWGVDLSHCGDSVALTSPQLPLLIPELNEAECILWEF